MVSPSPKPPKEGASTFLHGGALADHEQRLKGTGILEIYIYIYMYIYIYIMHIYK